MFPMLESERPGAVAEMVPLSRVRPLGGSKWGRFYGGATVIRVAGPIKIIRENAVIHDDGRVSGAQPPADGALPAGGEPVFALPAGESVSLGQFLMGALNIALQAPPLPFAGPVLTPRQTDVLARLGRLRDYRALAAPGLFAEVVSVEYAPGTLPAAPMRLVADRLRPTARQAGTAIAILPARKFERFSLVNRASLTAWLCAKRFTVVEPERLKLAELLDHFAAAPVVILADPRQVGLLGLCSPGAKILEIAPEGWLDPAGHYVSDLLGLSWRPFLAPPPSYPLRRALPFGSLVPCSYEIPIRELAAALKIVADS